MAFLRFLSELRAPVLDYLMMGISYIGTPFAVVGIITWFYLNVNKDEAYGMSFAFYFSCLFAQGMKLVLRIPRPWNLDTTFIPVDMAVPTATGYSFPSVHTQSSTVLFGSIFFYYRKRPARALSLVLLFLIAFSRMYLGCHTPADVGCGFAIGTVVTIIVLPFWSGHRMNTRSDDSFAFFLIAFAAVLIFLTTALYSNGTVDLANAKDGFETAGVSIGFAAAFLWERRSLRFSVDGTISVRILRFLIALGGALAIEIGLRAISDIQPSLIVLRYALIGFWAAGVTPALCLRLGLCEKEV